MECIRRGTPFHVHDGVTVMQYYAPSLSAIQIYTRKSLVSYRNEVQETDTEYPSDDSERGNLLRLWSGTSEDSNIDPEGSLLAKEHLEHLYFQFFESCSPYARILLVNKSCFPDSNTLCHPTAGNDIVEYFTLGDLWNRYSEYSAYGAGTPLHLHDGKTVMQYYAPSLLAIQIYTRRTLVSPRNGVQEMETEYSSDNSESKNLLRLWSGRSEDSGVGPEGSLLAKEHLKYLYFQLFESFSPCVRMPLVDNVHATFELCDG